MTSLRTMPFSPFLPWQTSQRLAKIASPSLAVPRPAGSSFPSGPIMRSKRWISAWLSGVPTSGKARCAANTAAGAVSTISGTRTLSEHRIDDGPVAIDLPWLDGREVDGARVFFLVQILRREAPVRVQLLHGRLNVVGFVGGAGHDHRLV